MLWLHWIVQIIHWQRTRWWHLFKRQCGGLGGRRRSLLLVVSTHEQQHHHATTTKHDHSRGSTQHNVQIQSRNTKHIVTTAALVVHAVRRLFLVAIEGRRRHLAALVDTVAWSHPRVIGAIVVLIPGGGGRYRRYSGGIILWGRTDGRQWFRSSFAGIAHPTVGVGSTQYGAASALLQNGHRVVGRAHRRRLWHVVAGTAVTIFGHRAFVVCGRVAALARSRGNGRGAGRGARCGSRGGVALVAVTKV